MKSRISILVAAVAFVATLITSVATTAQDNQTRMYRHLHYKLIDLGTFGGPLSALNVEPTGRFATEAGIVVGGADTSIPTPVSDCFNPVLNQDCFISHAFVWRGNGLHDLGTLTGGNFSFAEAINQWGQIVGVSENGQIDPFSGDPVFHAVLWEGGKIHDLGTLGGTSSFAISVNVQGQITGPALNNVPDPFSMIGGATQTHAVMWEAGKIRDLGTLGGPDSFPVFVNDLGQVAGMSYTSYDPDPNTTLPPLDPFLWTKGKGMRDLGNFGGANAGVAGLNNLGQVTGTMSLAGEQSDRAFLWDGKQLAELGTLGGTYSFAFGLNDAGVVVGTAAIPGDQTNHAFSWVDGVMTDLGTVARDQTSSALNVNSKGQIVGASGDADGNFLHAFLWENGGPSVDLNALIPSNEHIQLVSADLITDDGEIVGAGKPPGCAPSDDSCGHVYVLIPCDDNHPYVIGCDYRPAYVAITRHADPIEVAGTSSRRNVATMAQTKAMTRFRAMMASRSRWSELLAKK